MPLWLLALALAAACPAAWAAGGLSELDRALLKDARYEIRAEDAVLSPPPESRRLEPPAVEEAVARLRALERKAALSRLDRVQSAFLADGKLAPADRGAAQLTLARDWDL